MSRSYHPANSSGNHGGWEVKASVRGSESRRSVIIHGSHTAGSSLPGLHGDSDCFDFQDRVVTSGHTGLIVTGNSGKIHLQHLVLSILVFLELAELLGCLSTSIRIK